MDKGRLEAFSDGVIAVIITIMVLELRVPHEPTWKALAGVQATFLTYVLSFVFVGIYWNNHHHLFHACDRINGRILWANLHLLFWLSLVPFVTGWMGENHFAAIPTAGYGVVLLMSGIAFTILAKALVAEQGAGSTLARAVGADVKGKISLLLYLLAIPVAFANQWIADAIYVSVALMWLAPDPRIEAAVRR